MPGPSTKAVHAGERPHESGSLNTPVVASTTFRFPEMPDGSPSRYIYSRYDNPTVQVLEDKVAALEGAEPGSSLAFASGLGAEQAIFGAFLHPGDTIVHQQGIYGGTTALLANQFAARGVQVHAAGRDAPDALPAGTRLVWIESITNPLLHKTDVSAWAALAHKHGALLCVDATFASPILQRPLELGADMVLHSATKYLGGHSDVTAGVITLRPELRDAVWTARRDQGATLDPHAADRVLRGIKTLALRMERHTRNAARLAQAARADAPGTVHAVHHPAPCGMLTLDLGSLEAAQAFRRALHVIVPAASLGGVESLVSLPVETSHAYASAEARAAMGVTDGLVRISVGIEDPEDLLEDLGRGLTAAATATPDPAARPQTAI